MNTRSQYFFQALRRNPMWIRERVAAVYRCNSWVDLERAIAEAYSREWYVDTVYGPDGRTLAGGPWSELLRFARVAGLRLQEERARERRTLRLERTGISPHVSPASRVGSSAGGTVVSGAEGSAQPGRAT